MKELSCISKEFIRRNIDGKKKGFRPGDDAENRVTEHFFENPDGTKLRYLTFPKLAECDFAAHCFSTREGGVSSGHYKSLNLSFTRGDEPGAVNENYDRICSVLETSKDKITGIYQSHTANVKVATMEDAGMGVTREKDPSPMDGLVTNVPGLCLMIFFADCVPLFFADPVNRAIGLAHSGWRGTVKKIGRETIKTMEREFGTKAEDLICAIGPSICVNCYEVSKDVAEKFKEEFPEREGVVTLGRTVPETGEQKYQLNLWLANRIIVEEAGVKPENIDVTDICTCCNPHLLFSHRCHGENRGNNGGFLMIKP